MANTKIEYGIEKKTEHKDYWDKMYVWSVNANTVAGSTPDINLATQKLKEFREWAELNNYHCQYRIIKTTITTEVVDE